MFLKAIEKTSKHAIQMNISFTSFYACFQCLLSMPFSMPYFNALFQCLISMPFFTTLFRSLPSMLSFNAWFQWLLPMPSFNAFFQYRIAISSLNAFFQCLLSVFTFNAIFYALQPRTKVFVHLSTQITSLFYKIIAKTTWAYKSALKVLSNATRLISVAQAV